MRSFTNPRKSSGYKVRKQVQHVCVVCGTIFFTRTSNASLCTDECRKVRRKEVYRRYKTNHQAQPEPGPLEGISPEINAIVDKWLIDTAQAQADAVQYARDEKARLSKLPVVSSGPAAKRVKFYNIKKVGKR